MFFLNINNQQDNYVLLLQKAIKYLHNEQNFLELKKLINTVSIESIIEALEGLNDIKYIINLISFCDESYLSIFFLSLSIENRLSILNKSSDILSKKIILSLNADDLLDVIEGADSEIYSKIILWSTNDTIDEIKKIRRYEDEQVGSIMNTTILTLNQGMSIAEALNYLKQQRDNFDIDQEIFVVNSDNIVVGCVNIQEIFFSNDLHYLIQDIMEKTHITIVASEKIEEAIEIFKKYQMNTIAIVNLRNRFLGVINHKDILPEIIDDNKEEVYQIHAINNTPNSYMQSSVFEVVKSRILWLIMLLLATTITNFVIDKFEGLGFATTLGISSALLVPMLPMITGMSGNCGSQTTGTLIQAFSLKNMTKKQFKKILIKELQIASTVGILLSIFNFCRLIIYYNLNPVNASKLSNISSASNHITIIGVVGALISSISLFWVVVVSKFMAVIVTYIVFIRGYNPAVISGPILTTMLDTISSIIFFSIGIGCINLFMNILSISATTPTIST